MSLSLAPARSASAMPSADLSAEQAMIRYMVGPPPMASSVARLRTTTKSPRRTSSSSAPPVEEAAVLRLELEHALRSFGDQRPDQLLIVDPAAALKRVEKMRVERIGLAEHGIVAALDHARAARAAEQTLDDNGDGERGRPVRGVKRCAEPGAASAQHQDVGVETVDCEVGCHRWKRGGRPRRAPTIAAARRPRKPGIRPAPRRPPRGVAIKRGPTTNFWYQRRKWPPHRPSARSPAKEPPARSPPSRSPPSPPSPSPPSRWELDSGRSPSRSSSPRTGTCWASTIRGRLSSRASRRPWTTRSTRRRKRESCPMSSSRSKPWGATGRRLRRPADAVPLDRGRQWARDRAPPNPADFRQAPLRLEVPPAAHEPRAAGNRHLCGRHVRPAHDGQAGADHLAHEPQGLRPLFRGLNRHQDERAADLREQEDRVGAPARHPSDARDRGALPEGPRLGGRVPRADGDRESARGPRLRDAGGRDAKVSADDQRAAAPAQGDQAASVRDRARDAAPDAARHEEPHPRGASGRRLQPGLA